MKVQWFKEHSKTD